MIIQAELGPEDNVTTNGNLTYRVYDSGVLLADVGSAASAQNVTLSGSLVTIDIPTNEDQDYLITVAAVDEAGNESPISNVLQARDSVGQLIHEDNFADLSSIQSAATGNVLTNQGGSLRIASDGTGQAPLRFLILNSQFSLSPGNFQSNRTYAFELDIASITGQVETANFFRTAFVIDGPQQVWIPTLAGQTIRWQRTGQSNGSVTFGFSGENGVIPNWTTNDSIEIAAVRIFDLGVNP